MRLALHAHGPHGQVARHERLGLQDLGALVLRDEVRQAARRVRGLRVGLRGLRGLLGLRGGLDVLVDVEELLA